MVERRSLGEAMLSPEKMAFINTKETTAPPAKKVEDVKTIELETSAEKEPAPEPKEKTQRRGRNKTSVTPNADELLGQVLVPVTIRLQHRTAQSLKRAYLEQQLRHAMPDTQQEIVEEAVSDWLTKQGFLD